MFRRTSNILSNKLVFFLLTTLAIAAFTGCNSIPIQRADKIIVQTITRSTLPLRQEAARASAHAVQCAIGTRSNCDEFRTDQNESASTHD